MTTTPTGVAEDTQALDHDPSDGEASFLAHFLAKDPDAAKSSESETDEPRKKKPVVDDTDTETEETSDDSPEETEDEDEGEEDAKAKKYVEDDETYTKIKIGEEEHEVPVSKLKRLYGQEAALTQKSQALAAKAKEVETQSTHHATALQALTARAIERAKPYATLDFLTLSRDPNISAEQLHALRTEAQERIEEANFLQSELGNYSKAVQQQQHTALVAQAKETVKVLADPTHDLHIEGWNQGLYNDIRNFAIKSGLSADIANNLVDAPAIKLLHMAMKYQAGSKNVTTTKVNKTVKKVIKTSKTMPTAVREGKGSDVAKASAKLKSSGSVDDAADLFLARFKSTEE